PGSLLKCDGRRGGAALRFSQGRPVVRGHQRGAVGSVCFVAVILLGVGRSRKHNAALAAESANGKREFGSGTEAVKQKDLNAISRKDIGYRPGQAFRVVAAVLCYGNTGLLI